MKVAATLPDIASDGCKKRQIRVETRCGSREIEAAASYHHPVRDLAGALALPTRHERACSHCTSYAASPDEPHGTWSDAACLQRSSWDSLHCAADGRGACKKCEFSLVRSGYERDWRPFNPLHASQATFQEMRYSN